MKHTGERWNVGEDGDVFADDCVCVATVVQECFEAPQNARLIAAAPDMLAAIKQALDALRCEGEFEHLSRRSSGEQIDAAHDILSEVLAKTERTQEAA